MWIELTGLLGDAAKKTKGNISSVAATEDSDNILKECDFLILVVTG